MTGALLEIHSAVKRFADHEVLKGIDLDIAEHEVVCLIGASGSGKSTLLRCINGLLPLDGGSIVVDGMTVSQYEAELNFLRREVGIVFQSFNLFPHMTVLKNVMLAPRKVLGVPRAEAAEQAQVLLERIGLGEARRVPRPALGRSTTAGRDRSGARDATEAHAARRDHERARPGTGRERARAGARARR